MQPSLSVIYDYNLQYRSDTEAQTMLVFFSFVLYLLSLYFLGLYLKSSRSAVQKQMTCCRIVICNLTATNQLDDRCSDNFLFPS